MPRKKPWPPKYGVPDDENPEWTAEDFARARPLIELIPDVAEGVERLRARLGRPRLEHPKEHVTLRLDAEVVNGFKEDGPGWQGRINETLLKAVRRRKPAKRKKRPA
jgi:uncharacterized protein (DUF4415 family)